LIVALALAVSACGSDTKHAATTTTSTTSTTPVSVQAFVSAANGVCMAADRRIVKLGRLTRDPKGWQTTADAARVAVRQMRAVKPPPSKAQAFNQMLHYANALTLSIQEVHDSLVKKDIDTAAAAQFAAAQIQDKVHQAAKSAGLTFCQQPLTNWPA
jgi:hypothetical protein